LPSPRTERVRGPNKNPELRVKKVLKDLLADRRIGYSFKKILSNRERQ
jgi:hypothetical protein